MITLRSLKKYFLTQIYANLTQIHTDFQMKHLRPSAFDMRESAFKRGFFRTLTQIILGVAAIVLVISGTGFAKEDKEKDQEKIAITSEMKEVEGEVSAISKDYIAVVYSRDEAKAAEYEMAFPIDKNARIVHKRSLSEIAVGDTVGVQYEELTEEHKEGPRQIRTAKVITFLRPAPKRPEIIETQDEPEEEEPLPLKGTR